MSDVAVPVLVLLVQPLLDSEVGVVPKRQERIELNFNLKFVEVISRIAYYLKKGHYY